MLNYDTFFRNIVVHRTTDLGNTKILKAMKELPATSILHMVDNFNLDEQDTPKIAPDTSSPIYTMKPDSKQVHMVRGFVHRPTDIAEVDTSNVRLITMNVLENINAYRYEQGGHAHTLEHVEDLPTRTDAQCIVNYNPLFNCRVTGVLPKWHFFNALLGTIVNTIAALPTREHIIHFPLTKLTFEPQEFTRIIKKMDRTTLKHPEMPHYLMMAQLLTYIHPESDVSIFESIPEELASKVHVLFTHAENFVVYRLDQLKTLNGKGNTQFLKVIKQINALSINDGDIRKVLPVTDESQVFFVLTNVEAMNKKVVRDAKNKPAPNVVFTTVEGMMKFKAAQLKIGHAKSWGVAYTSIPLSTFKGVDINTKNPEFDSIEIPGDFSFTFKDVIKFTEADYAKVQSQTVDEKLVKVDTSVHGKNTTGFSEEHVPQDLQHKEKARLDEIASKAAQKVKDHPTITRQQAERAVSVIDAYKKLTLGGRTLEEILTTPIETTISDSHLDFLEGQIEDKSMLKSTVHNFSKGYMEKTFHKDLAANLVSFRAQGMNLIDLTEEDKSDKFNRLTEYTASYEEIGGKRHTVKFMVPKVDRDGLCKVNGVTKLFGIQRVGVPIVKDRYDRVTLCSNLNKVSVERVGSVAHSFDAYVRKLISKAPTGRVVTEHGSLTYNEPYSYEFTSLAKTMKKLRVASDTKQLIAWNFDLSDNKFYDGTRSMNVKVKIEALEKKYGLYMGYGSDYETGYRLLYFLSTDGVLSVVNNNDDRQYEVMRSTTIIDELVFTTGVEIQPLREWVELNVLQKAMPVGFALSYRFGLSPMLKYLGVNYSVFERRERINYPHSDIVLPFADKKIVIHKPTKLMSLIFGGLTSFDMTNILFEEMDKRDAYLDLISQKKLSINYLKGVDTIFDMFIDPITADVLAQMNEPTNMRDLLIRATSLLVTEDHVEPASAKNFRFRSYERMNAAIYNKMSRALAAYQNGSRGAKKTFSLSPYEVLQTIVGDPLFVSIDIINPIEDIKLTCGYSHIGEGGRTSEAFVVGDRRFTKDNIGIMSEATVDTGKVAIDGMLSMSPTIVNSRGLTKTKDINALQPSEILSSTALLVPSLDQDDGKRAKQKLAQPYVSVVKVKAL